MLPDTVMMALDVRYQGCSIRKVELEQVNAEPEKNIANLFTIQRREVPNVIVPGYS